MRKVPYIVFVIVVGVAASIIKRQFPSAAYDIGIMAGSINTLLFVKVFGGRIIQ